MDFEKLHYPSVGNKNPDYMLCEGKKYEVVKKSNNDIVANLIDEDLIYPKINGVDFSLVMDATFYNCIHHITLTDRESKEVYKLSETSLRNKLDIFRHRVPEIFRDKIFNVKIKVKNTTLKKESYIFRDLTRLVKLNDLTKDFYFFSSAVVGDYIYLFGSAYTSSVSCYKYSLLDGKIYSIANKPTNTYNSEACAFNDKIYIIGGYNRTSYNIECYDPKTNTWESKEAIESGHEFSSAVFDNSIYYLGGVASSAMKVYNPSSDTITSKPNMPSKKQRGRCFISNNKLYAIGGISSDTKNHVYCFDFQTNTWTTKNNSLKEYSNSANIVSIHNIGYALGMGNYGYSDLNYKYDSITDTWTQIVSFDKVMGNFRANIYKDKIYVLGGTNKSTTDSVKNRTVYLFE